MTLSEQPRRPVSFLVLSAALRGDSLNKRLGRLAGQVIERQGGSVDHASMHDFDVPSYDGDVELSQGLPPGAQQLRRAS